MFKIIRLTGEEFGLQIDRHSDSEAAVLRINDFILDAEKSELGKPAFKERSVLEIYPTVKEIREIITALQQVLPEEEKQPEPIGFK